MPPLVSSTWSLRLADLLGAGPDAAEEEHLQRLVDGGVREDADLDFKQARYGNSESARRDLAGDIAAMANDRGGLITVGVREENDVAVELSPVELADGEEARIRQIAAANIAPHVAFDVRVVASDVHQGAGYYFIIVPPSTQRPHAVRKDRDLRYPRRDGSTTRWLGEVEVADMYRNRFAVARSQTSRVREILDVGLGAMILNEASVAVALVPTGTGAMSIDLAQLAAVERWAREVGPPRFFGGLYEQGAPPSTGVGSHRVTVATIHDSGRRPGWTYAELYDDGAGFACTRLPDPRRGWSGDRAGTWVLNEALLYGLSRCLQFVGRHAAENCGAWNDALVEARVVGTRMSLAYLDQTEFLAQIAGGRVVDNAMVSRHMVVVDAVTRVGPALLAATRMLATDLFHAFGSPEVRHIAPDGTLRISYFRGDQRPLREWANQNAIPLTEDPVPGE